MQRSLTLDCNGLPHAPTVLRIKQALVGNKAGSRRVGVLVGADCDHARITGSLGKLASRIELLSGPAPKTLD
ncbi:hypothetical protein [Novosphingobium sp. BW1]|uniref:hypothetical protein n=1 Tax=Novosphingobium sp. BW1 TaxID=2592621 RepID=UPI0011DE5AB7|nr:hypothetical protein [Novosphingobium sp. BW1]TYC90467.1 hypothetical protein FMM79_07270 [Novosphingobium sp. BW1]